MTNIIHSTGQARIYNDNGGFVLVATHPTFSGVAGTPYHFKVVLSGSQHSFAIDGGLSVTVDNALFSTATKHGFWLNGGTGNERWDNFTVAL